ncbi:MAG: hypothetical protein AAGA65_18060 [Actinomycetota bacterium]
MFDMKLLRRKAVPKTVDPNALDHEHPGQSRRSLEESRNMDSSTDGSDTYVTRPIKVFAANVRYVASIVDDSPTLSFLLRTIAATELIGRDVMDLFELLLAAL